MDQNKYSVVHKIPMKDLLTPSEYDSPNAPFVKETSLYENVIAHLKNTPNVEIISVSTPRGFSSDILGVMANGDILELNIRVVGRGPLRSNL